MTLKDFKASIEKKQWHRAVSLIRTNSTLSRKKYSIPSFVTEVNADASEIYPIHHVCSKVEAPVELIEFLSLKFPEGIYKTESSMQRTCLHIAILNSLPDRVISYLIDLNPMAVQAQDKYGRVPLHYACSKTRSFESIKEIIRPFPQCIKAPDWKIWTPLHVAVTKNNDPDIVKYMLSLYPETLSMITSSGLTLLDALMNAQEYHNKHVIMNIIIQKKVEFDELPESQNLRNSTIRPLTPLIIQSYSIV